MAPETPKGVSSRLLTMKFMQRAAASTPSAGSPNSDAPSTKKRKLHQSPAPGRIDPNIDQALIQAALDQQEATRQAALEKHSAADTHWVLKTKIDETQSQKQSCPLNVVYVGYGDLDFDANEDSPAEGRTSSKPSKQDAAARERGASDSDGESNVGFRKESDGNSKRKNRPSDSNPNDVSSIFSRSRSQSQSRNDAESIRAKEFREKRKKKDVRLNNLTSISSAGDGQFLSQGLPNSDAIKCYNCQKMGHRASDCTTKTARKRS